MGGLGNQMFQYAVARRLAHVNKAQMKLDLSWFANVPLEETHRQYELHVFNTVQTVASPREIKALRGRDFGGWPKLVKRLLKTAGVSNRTHLKENGCRFVPELLDLHGDFYLDGYWQNAGYFDDIEDIIRGDLTFRSAPDSLNDEIGKFIGSCEAVSLHVRRGDYVENKATERHHGICSLDYYAAAIAKVTAQVHNPHFFVFSDDPDWAKGNLDIAGPATYLEHNTPEKGCEDLRLISLCKHHIIANSSFSWWGAWLNKNRDGLVCAPAQWVNDPEMNANNPVSDSWIRL